MGRLRLLLVAVLAATVLATPPAPASAAPSASTPSAEDWPVPLPDWFWRWARWYLGRAEFKDEPFRSDATRPGVAPDRIPEWARRRLEALLEPGTGAPQRPEPQRTVRTWPLPVPQWFWAWARWYLGRAEFADDGPRAADVRPAAAPRYVPAWAWQRLRVLNGGEPTPVPTGALARGDQGPQVAAMQRALNGARYVAGSADGNFGTKTRYAVVAFQKAHGYDPDGVVSPEEWLAIMRTTRPAPPLDEDDYVYVDLEQQLLYDVQGGSVHRVLTVSTGGGYEYTGLDDEQHIAVTPTGRFEVFRKVEGKDTSYLGTLYYPSYFQGGYAIHGSQSVPPRPVSHGCVRIPLWLAQEFFERVRIGTPVIVR
jgi:N-acetylmuramoyl-L-alanine amidase